jgi:hypothetical protein
MIADVPETAQQLADELADAFEQDRGLAQQQNACRDRLRSANARLWSGVHPDALGLIYDDIAAIGGDQGSSVIAGSIVDAVCCGESAAEVEAAVLPGLRETHWTIHRAFCEYQQLGEDRRHLAAELGELIAALATAGCSEQDARQAGVHQLTAVLAR